MFKVENMSLYYGDKMALNFNMELKKVTFIGRLVVVNQVFKSLNRMIVY